MAHEACRGVNADEKQDGRADSQEANLALRLRLEFRQFLGMLFRRRQLLGFSFGFCAAMA